MSRERQNLATPAVLLDQCQPLRPQHFSQTVATPLCFHLWSLHPTTDLTILEQHRKQNSFSWSLWQHRRYETMTSQAIGQQQRDEIAESWSSSEGLEERHKSAWYQGLPYIPKIFRFKVINCHHNGPLVGYFGTKKTRKLVGRKYYWPSLRKNVRNYVKKCDISLASKIICHKPYGDLQSLLIPTYRWKDFPTDFVTGLPLPTDWKGNSYDLILVIVNCLTKMVYYKPIKATNDMPKLAKVIINVLVQHHGLLDSIISNRGVILYSSFGF